VLDWGLIAIGFGIGLAVAAPMGPVNIMIIHRGVQGGFMSAFVAGLGAVLGDGLYAAIAAFGVTAISDTIENHIGAIQLVGGIVLIGFGSNLVFSTPHPEERVDEDTRLSMLGAAVSSFVLAVTNPALLLGFVAIFAGLDEIGRAPDNYALAAQLTVGVLAGGLLWWFLLASLVARFRHRITLPWLRGINAAAGIALAIFGALLLADIAIGGF
jgi:threonine/homoserine/homoserine lactone efflux protein